MRKITKKKKIGIILGVLVLIIIASFVAVNLYLNSMLSNINQEEKLEEKDANISVVHEEEKAHKVVNFLLLGLDNDDGDFYSYNGRRSDATKIVSMDYTTKKVKITSLQRDITVFIPGDYQNYGHVNWAYSYGGPKLAVQTVNYNLDLDITKYVVIPYAGFIAIIDQIGGIDIELTSLEAAALNGEVTTNALAKHYMVAGMNHLDGYDALAYARERFIDSDFERVKRQNKVIQAVIDKIKSLSYSELLGVVEGMLPYITTDLDNDEIKTYLIDILSFDLNDIQKYTWPNGEYDSIYKNDVLGGYLLKSYKDEIINLHKFIWEIDDYKPSDTALKNIDNIYNKYGKYEENE